MAAEQEIVSCWAGALYREKDYWVVGSDLQCFFHPTSLKYCFHVSIFQTKMSLWPLLPLMRGFMSQQLWAMALVSLWFTVQSLYLYTEVNREILKRISSRSVLALALGNESGLSTVNVEEFGSLSNCSSIQKVQNKLVPEKGLRQSCIC